MKLNRNKIKGLFISFLWLVAGAGCITLLVSAVYKKEAKRCKGVEIEISGVTNNYFIDRNDVYAIIKNYGGDSTLRKPLASIDLKRIEKELEKDVWIKNAELFFDNNNMLKITVEEREPVARVFTATNTSFYIDSSCMMLPLSEKFSARLPVFTGFTAAGMILSKPDSNLLCDIKNISIKILKDSFLMAMIDQVDITANRSFEMTPKFGKQVILFGDATDADAKFARLKLFYKNVIAKAGWNRYNTINLQYKDQVVAAIRGKEDVAADSLRTLSIMKMIAEEAARKSSDSTQSFVQDSDKNSADSSMVQQSFQRDDEGTGAPAEPQKTIITSAPAVPVVTATAKPAEVKPTVIKPAAAVIKKPVAAVTKKPVQPSASKPKPILTMPPKAVIKKPGVQQKKLPQIRIAANDY